MKKYNKKIKSNQNKTPNLTGSLFFLIKYKPNNINNMQLRLTAKFPNIKDSGKV